MGAHPCKNLIGLGKAIKVNMKTIEALLQEEGSKNNDKNKENWNHLNTSERLFYIYLIKNDTNLSSILVGVFSAYVVNVFSNLISLEFEFLLNVGLYVVNAFFAVRVLYFVIMLYSIHLKSERIEEKDEEVVHWNKNFEKLFITYGEQIKENLKKLMSSTFLLLIALLLCCMLNNMEGDTVYYHILHLVDCIRDYIEKHKGVP